MSRAAEIYHARLVEWVLATVGQAIALSVAVGAVFGVAAVATEVALLAWVGLLLGPIAFAAVLYGASAPLPVDEPAEVDEE